MIRYFRTGAVLAAATLLLSGCTFTASANLTVPASTIEQQSADILQKQVQAEQPPGMDCGDEAIDLVEGNVIDCILSDPTNGAQYDATVELSDIDGANYHLEVNVADTPR